MDYELNTELFVPWFIFTYKGNRNIVLRDTQVWAYIIDIDYDPTFSEDLVNFVSWGTLFEDLFNEQNLHLFTKTYE